MPTFNTFEMKQSFWKSVKYLWRYRIFAGTVYRLKVENFKSCRWAKFSPCHCKSKIPAHLKFSAQMPTFNMLRWSKVFENRVNTFGDIGFLLGQFTGWKWEISNLVDGLSFHLVIAKVKYLRTCNFRPKCPLSTRLRWSKVFENRLNTFGDIGFLLGQFTGWKWEISNLVDGLSFHLVIAKLKYLRTWNFRHKCPLSTRLRGSKVFENRLNTFGDMGFLLVQFTWLKVGNFKSCRWAKFSPCHCKSKILTHLKFSAQIPSFNMCEMKQSFWKSVKYLWRYMDFCWDSLQVESGKFQILSMG